MAIADGRRSANSVTTESNPFHPLTSQFPYLILQPVPLVPETFLRKAHLLLTSPSTLTFITPSSEVTSDSLHLQTTITRQRPSKSSKC
jgi:hypothetical protein